MQPKQEAAAEGAKFKLIAASHGNYTQTHPPTHTLALPPFICFYCCYGRHVPATSQIPLFAPSVKHVKFLMTFINIARYHSADSAAPQHSYIAAKSHGRSRLLGLPAALGVLAMLRNRLFSLLPSYRPTEASAILQANHKATAYPFPAGTKPFPLYGKVSLC